MRHSSLNSRHQCINIFNTYEFTAIITGKHSSQNKEDRLNRERLNGLGNASQEGVRGQKGRRSEEENNILIECCVERSSFCCHGSEQKIEDESVGPIILSTRLTQRGEEDWGDMTYLYDLNRFHIRDKSSRQVVGN